MTPAAGLPEPLAQQRSLLFEVFHALSQPLTALQCSLEISLARDKSAEELRASLEAALQNAERLRQKIVLLRELSEADDPGDTSATVALSPLLQQLQEELLPLFESAGQQFGLTGEAVHVRGNGPNLLRGFYYLVEFLQRNSAPGAGIAVHMGTSSRQQAEIQITQSGSLRGAATADSRQTEAAWEWRIAQRIFRAARGDLEVTKSTPAASVWQIRLPLAN